MITEAEFLQAVSIIKEYKKQIDEVIIEASAIKSSNKTLISKWLSDNRGIDKRLYNCLDSVAKGRELYVKEDYIEDLDKKTFYKIRNAGSTAWRLFLEARGIDPWAHINNRK